MNEITVSERQLPDNLEDLAKFVLVGREKLNAVRAEIRAIKAVNLAVEVHEQKLSEAQDIAEAVLDAEMKIGELTKKMEKAKNQYASNSGVTTTKSEKLSEIGIDKMQASRFERLATHPETVEKAKADARAEGRIVTRQDVISRIVTPKPKQQTFKEMKQTAVVEHLDFKEKKKEHIVNFSDIKKEKENVELISLDTIASIRKAISAVGTLMIIPKEEIDLIKDNMEERDKKELILSLRNAMRTIVHLMNLLGGE